ncbi:MAG: hypothetical protein QNJ62_06605 [Methyloceanibacter sp.]|nr:hypothetical protein [Methyloceanibacter sp.]
MRPFLIFILTFLAAPVVQAQSNPDLSGFTPTAKAIVEYAGGGAGTVVREIDLGWGAPQKYRIELLPGVDRWVYPVTSLVHCNALLVAGGDTPTDNRFTRAQNAYDTMLAGMTDTTDPANSYTVRCEDGWP